MSIKRLTRHLRAARSACRGLCGLRHRVPPCSDAPQLAESQQDFDRAVIEYTKVVRTDPNDRNRSRLARAGEASRRSGPLHARPPAWPRSANSKRHSSNTSSRPSSIRAIRPIQDEMRTVRAQLRAKIAVNEEGKTRLETLIAQSLEAPLPGNELARRHLAARYADLPRSERPRSVLSHRQVREPQRRLRSRVPRSADHHRPAQGRAPAGSRRCHVRHAKLLARQRSAHRSIIPDTPAKRREYEDEIVRTFYLSNADLKETVDILRIVVDARRISSLSANQRDHDQGHARANRRRRPHHQRDRQGPPRGGH